MYVKVKPGAIFVRVRRSIEEDYLALVPALVTFTDIGQVEASEAIRRVRGYPGHSSLVALA